MIKQVKYKVGDVVKYCQKVFFIYKELQNTYGIIIKHKHTLYRPSEYRPSEEIEIYFWYSFVSMKIYEFSDKVLFP